MVDINVNKDQGLISAIKAKLNAEQIDTSNCNASIWSQVLEQVTIENEQNKKDGKQLIYHKGNDMNGDGHKNFVIFQGVIKFSQKLWDNICKIVRGETFQNTTQPTSGQSVSSTPQTATIQEASSTSASGVGKIQENNFIRELNQIQEVQPSEELESNIKKAQQLLIEQLQSFTEQDLQTLGISAEKRDRLLKYLENIKYNGTHNTMQGKGVWIVVSNRLEGSDDLASMVTMLMHEANHCDENFLSKYPEYADNSRVRSLENSNPDADIMLVNTKSEEKACETLGLLTTAILYKKGVIKDDYARYSNPVSAYIDDNGQPTQALKNDIDNWVSGYTNYPENMNCDLTIEHMFIGHIQELIEKYIESLSVPETSPEYAEAQKIQQLFEKYKDSPQVQTLLNAYKNNKDLSAIYDKPELQIQAGDILVVENDDGSLKQVTLGNNGAILSCIDSAPIFQLVNAEFSGNIIFDDMQPTDIEYMCLEYLANKDQRPEQPNNYQRVSIIRNGEVIYKGKLY